MVSKDRIQEEGLTTDDVMDREFVEPKTEPEILPEWEEYPEEAPGENVRIEDDELVWERDGFEARVRSHETTHWKATIHVPRDVGQYWARPVDLKCRPYPEYGHIESVEVDEYAATTVTLLFQENFQPTYEVNSFIDNLIEEAEATEQRRKEINEKLELAEENED